MGFGLEGAPRLWLRILLWVGGAVIVAVLVLLVGMEYSISKNGGGEMVHTLGLMIGLIIIAYYTIVLALGRIMLNRGGASWGWHFVALMMVLVFVPMVYLWKITS